MLAKVTSLAVLGVDAYPVEVEVDLAPGLPVFNLVGLPDGAVRESKERVRAALTEGAWSAVWLDLAVLSGFSLGLFALAVRTLANRIE